MPHKWSGRNAPQRSEAAVPGASGGRPDLDREQEAVGAAAATGLAIAGVAPAILVTAIPETRALIGPSSAANILIALLILAPAGVGLAGALSGLPRVAGALRREAGTAAEQAVLRIFADTLLFGSALWLAAVLPNGLPPPAVPAAAIGVAAAWAVLLALMLRPSFAPLLRRCGTALDLGLLSVCLHLGGTAAAGGYPIYLLLTFYAGCRFGEGALAETALGSLAGFGIAVLTTGFWRQQPGLSLGLLAALIVLPACLCRLLRVAAAANAAAAAAEASRTKSLAAVSDALRPALAVLGGAADRPVRALAERIGGLLDLVAIEAGEFSVPSEAFDFRELLNESLAPLAIAAAEKGVALRWRIDPRLPPSLQGPAAAITRIVGGLANHLVDLAPAGSVRIALDTIDRSGSRVKVRLRFAAVRTAASGGGGSEFGQVDRAPTSEGEALTLGVAARLVSLIGGEFDIEAAGVPPDRFAVTLSLGVAQQTPEADLDLRGCPVSIVSGDDRFAAELAGLLGRWRANARWIGEAEEAAAELGRLDTGVRPVLIVDGRDRPLAALALVENLARTAVGRPFVLFVAENSRVERLVELDEAALDCLLPAPVTERLLANAFRGLPLGAGRAGTAVPSLRPEIDTPAAMGDGPEIVDDRVTPIAAHPKFGSETAVLEMRTIEGLRVLGGGQPFLADLIDTFEADARRHLDSLGRAVADADAAAFSRSIAALRRCAGNLGATRLCELLSAAAVNDTELRQRGRLHLQQLASETERLIAALQEIPPPTRAQRS